LHPQMRPETTDHDATFNKARAFGGNHDSRASRPARCGCVHSKPTSVRPMAKPLRVPDRERPASIRGGSGQPSRRGPRVVPDGPARDILPSKWLRLLRYGMDA
jgi:hypothetical protein